jgi:TetR/AcrR family transcriptional regulator, transcriptional repressor for nem operon
MSYPKDHKAQTKDRILQSAMDLFSRYGFNKVSIDEIMKSAKMTHGAFYAYFESKEALYQASFLGTLKNSRAARLVKGPLSLGHLTRLVTNYWNLNELEKNSRPGPETIMVNELGDSDSDIKGLFEESYNNLKKMIETRIAALIKLKQLHLDASPEAISEKARVILVSLIGAVAIAKKLTQEDERRLVLQSTQRQILNMLGVDESRLITEGEDQVAI